MTILTIVAGILVVGFAGLLVYSLCRISAKSDEMAEEIFNATEAGRRHE